MGQAEKKRAGGRVPRPALALLSLLLLPACLDQGQGGVARLLMPDPAPVAEGLDADATEAETSVVLQDLMARRSALPPDTALDKVAGAVLVADTRAAQAELRSARLRARAQSRNWLPSIGPQVSLSSLGSVVAMLVVEQVLFDNGRKLAERDFAKADVEVAAVALVQDSNDRVLTALTLYLAAREAQDKALLAQAAERDMTHFEWVMSERVAGGISDRSDLQVLHQKLAEIRATGQTETEAARAALAELSAMGVGPDDLADHDAIAPLHLPETLPVPLPVRLAEAEKNRAEARARIDRAGFLPAITANAALGRGAPDPSLDIRTSRPLGFGTADDLRAIAAATEGESRKVDQAREESNRQLRRLEQERTALMRQAAEATVLSNRAKANLDLFQSQYDAGQRQVMDVVGLYEQFARQQQSVASLRYRAALAELQIAATLGLLADGDKL
ncbi:MAG: TolC family protein [Paracoccaceae bacterium]|uniref:TolC family protein n=1 Tax=Seohaeicola saemankumensis TaxID=481181 RepID=UPI001E34EF2C|nr:TolC family protein [Seohaeicola saemankumensis]MCD1625542.1 TolC family protein [Seohaeicola saemankumensis]